MAEKGKLVRVHYTGTLDDGTQFDSSEGREPLEFNVGTGMMIPGFDAAVLEMEVGEERDVHIPAAEAYGAYDDSAVVAQPLDMIPNADKLPVGQKIYFTTPDGRPMPCKVLKVDDGKAYFDFNHELAGKDLDFHIRLLEIVD